MQVVSHEQLQYFELCPRIAARHISAQPGKSSNTKQQHTPQNSLHFGFIFASGSGENIIGVELSSWFNIWSTSISN